MKYESRKKIVFFMTMLGLTAFASGCGSAPPVVPAAVPVSTTNGLTTGACVPIILPTTQSYAVTPTGLTLNIQNAWMNSNTLAAGNVSTAPSGVVQPAPAGAYGTVIAGPGSTTLPAVNGLTMFATDPNPSISPDGAVVLTITSTPTTTGTTSVYPYTSYPYSTAATGSRWNGTGMIQITAQRIQQWMSATSYNYGYGYNYGYPTTIGVTQSQTMTACVNSVALNLSFTNVTGTNRLYAGYASIGLTVSGSGGARQGGFVMKF